MIRAKVCYISKFKTTIGGEHAFPLMGIVCKSAHVTSGGSGGIRSTARPELPYPRPELPYPCNSQAKSRDETSLRGE